jgi:hypothetical protein
MHAKVARGEIRSLLDRWPERAIRSPTSTLARKIHEELAGADQAVEIV